jgi:hypothetical protein
MSRDDGRQTVGSLFFWPIGAVAQLGEHLLCKQGVTGSIPVRSTRNAPRVCIRVAGGFSCAFLAPAVPPSHTRKAPREPPESAAGNP